MYRVVTAVIALAIMPMSAHALTAKDIQEIGAKIGRPLEVGYAPVTPPRALPKLVSPRPVAVFDAPRRASPNLVDLSALPPGYVPPSNVPDAGAYSAKLEARSLKIFGYGREEERQQWMADQEQREIANRINASKPLLVPVNSR
jgi:hypothetical protein